MGEKSAARRAEGDWTYLDPLLVVPTVVGTGTLVRCVVVPVDVTGLVIVIDPLVMVWSETDVKSTVVKTSVNDVDPSASDSAFAATCTPALLTFSDELSGKKGK